MEDKHNVDSGQVALIVVAAAAIAMAVILALGRLGLTVVQRAQIEAAADAVALAALSGGVTAADSVAAANNVEIVALDIRQGWVQVSVRRDGEAVTSTAVWAAARPLTAPPGGRSRPVPALEPAPAAGGADVAYGGERHDGLGPGSSSLRTV